MEYHLACQLTGDGGRDMTLIDLNLLVDYLDKIRAVRYVACIEPATRDHLHCVYELSEKRPQIKRDLVNAMKIDTKQYPNNAIYNKQLKTGQTFEMLGGGYLQKGFKFIKTKGISHVELEEGREQYTVLKERKCVRLSKHNMVRHIVDEMKQTDSKDWEVTMKMMMRNPMYNFSYVCNAFTKTELDTLIHFQFTEPNSKDDMMFEQMFKREKEYY